MSATVNDQVAWEGASALVVAAPERCVLEVTGADRLSWLNGLLSCQLDGRKEGEAVFGLALGQKGKIVSDVIVVVAKDRALLAIQRGAAPTLVASFEHHLMMEDAELRELPGDVWFVHGPRAGEVALAAREAGATTGTIDVTGHGGAVIVVTPGSDAVGAIERAARAAGGGVGDAEGWDVVRVRAAVPRFGVDFDETTYPQEAALETRAVSFQKGCYLGQEIVCMLEMRGHVKRKLVSLAVAVSEPPLPHAPVDDAKGATVGEVTSAVRAADGEVRALAMVKYACIEAGTELVVGGRKARVL